MNRATHGLILAAALGCAWPIAVPTAAHAQAPAKALVATAQPSAAATASTPASPGGRAQPRVVSAELIGTYTQERLSRVAHEELLTFMKGTPVGHEPFMGKFSPPVNALKLYRLRYLSVVPELSDRSVVASGLVAIPDTPATSVPEISYQHGTVFEKDSVPSCPDQSIETRLMLSQFGGQGYAVIAADYFGLGDSEVANAFFLRDSFEQATFDFYLAAMLFLEQQAKRPRALATFGWSQGGYSNMILLRKLERAGRPPHHLHPCAHSRQAVGG